MFELEVNKIKSGVSILPHKIVIELIANELQIVIPSLDDIKKQDFKDLEISNEKGENHLYKNLLDTELSNLLNNYKNYKDNDKFNYRISSLYHELGLYEKEKEYLDKIDDIYNKPFYRNKLLVNNLKMNLNSGVRDLKKYHDFDAILNLGLAYIQKKDIENAFQTIYELSLVYNHDYKVMCTLSLIYTLKRDFNSSISSLRNLTKNGNYDDNICYLFSLAYYLNNQYEKSYKYSKIGNQLNKFNKNLIIIHSLASDKLNIKDNIASLELYLTVKEDKEVYERLAKAYYYNSEYKKAESVLKKLLIYDDKCPSIWNNLALIYNKKRIFDKSESYYLAAIQNIKNKQDYLIIMNYFKFLYMKKDFENIKKVYEELKLNELNSNIFHDCYNIHICYLDSLKCLNNNDEYINKILSLYDILKKNDSTNNRLLNKIICYYSSVEKNKDILKDYLNKTYKSLESHISKDERIRSINNIIFASIENHLLIDHNLIVELRSNLDKNPYYTATYGLINYNWDNLEKGNYYYEKALSLTSDNNLKKKLKTKRDIEQIKYYLKKNKLKRAESIISKIYKNKRNIEAYYLEEIESLIMKTK